MSHNKLSTNTKTMLHISVMYTMSQALLTFQFSMSSTIIVSIHERLQVQDKHYYNSPMICTFLTVDGLLHEH